MKRLVFSTGTVAFLVGLMLLPSLVTAQEDSPAGLVLLSRTDHLDIVAREPMIIRHPGGRLFLAGYPSQVTGTDWLAPPQMWQSDDDGTTWTRTDVGRREDGAHGNSDVDLAMAPDGTLYFVSMGYNRAAREGTHVSIGVSRDAGQSFRWHLLSETRFDDRPWVRVAEDGIVHVIWNDDVGVAHAVSRDGGQSWVEQKRIADKGGSSHLAVGPDGAVAVRISAIYAAANFHDAGADAIAVSRDNGATWAIHPVPGNVVWDQTLSAPGMVPRWVEPLAWGPDLTLWHLWSEGKTMWLGHSADFGASWSKQMIAQEDSMAFFPYMIINRAGDIAATWFIAASDQPVARVALIGRHDGAWNILRSAPFAIDSWDETTERRTPNTGGEYLPVIFLPNGVLGVAATIQDIRGDRWGFSYLRFGVAER